MLLDDGRFLEGELFGTRGSILKNLILRAKLAEFSVDAGKRSAE